MSCLVFVFQPAIKIRAGTTFRHKVISYLASKSPY